MESITYTLPDLTIAVGGNDGVRCRLGMDAALRVEFFHEAGYPDRLTEANGDPGEPGVPASFDFKRILATSSMVLSGAGGKVLVVVADGSDLYDLLDEGQRQTIEDGVLLRLAAQKAEARLEAHLGAHE